MLGNPTQQTPIQTQSPISGGSGGPPGQAFLDALLSVTRAINAQTQVVQSDPAKSYLFAGLPATPPIGLIAVITDSTTNTWGANITGGGGDTVLAFFNGSHWTVIGK